MLYSTIEKLVKERVVPNKPAEVIVPKSLFQELIKAALEAAPFDAEWYLRQNPDVREAVVSGRIKSARQHFIETGYYENRLPMPANVDDNYYASQNPDVLAAVQKGVVRSFTEHFVNRGRHEGRIPSEDFTVFLRKDA